MIFRLRYRRLGGHIHCRLFEAVDHTKTFAKNGDLVFDEKSWQEFLAQTGRTAIEVIPEDDVQILTARANGLEELLRAAAPFVVRAHQKETELGLRSAAADTAALLARIKDAIEP